MAKTLLIANLGGPRDKRVPLTVISEAVRLLVHDEEYGSFKKLAQDFKISRQILQSFYHILDQPKEIQELIEKGEILLDSSTKLTSIKNHQKRVEMARVVAGMSAFDARYIIDYWKKNPNLSPEECKQRVLESMPTIKETHLVVVPLNTELFNNFKNKANKKNLKVTDAALQAIQLWVNDKAG